MDAIRTTCSRGTSTPPTLPAPAAVVRGDAGRFYALAAWKDGIDHFYMEMVGAENPAGPSGSRTEINAEQPLAWNPDVILLGDFDAATPADFYDDPLYASLRAVQERQVYKMPLGGYRRDPPSQESPLA